MGALILSLLLLALANFWFAANAFTTWCSTTILTTWQSLLNPGTHILFAAENSKPLTDFIANLPESLVVTLPLNLQAGMGPLALCVAGTILAIALHQMVQMQKSLKDDYQIVPLTLVTALYLIPLVVPGATFGDLLLMVPAGLIIASLEWRKFSDWRLKTTVRVTIIAINSFALLVLFARQYAYPLILIAVLIVYFRRIVEAVHLAASEHGGVVQVFADSQPEFLD